MTFNLTEDFGNSSRVAFISGSRLLNSQIGIEALSSQLLWIGGMLLFGLGALLIRPGPSK
jgi:hypothetical protein